MSILICQLITNDRICKMNLILNAVAIYNLLFREKKVFFLFNYDQYKKQLYCTETEAGTAF